VVSPHNPGYLFYPSSLSFLEPPLQSSKQNSVGRLHLPVRLGVLDRCEHLLYAYLRKQLTQLLTRKLCTIVGDKAPRYTEATHNVLPHKVLYLWAVICTTGSASIHFVKYSIATIKYFICLIVNGKGPIMSIPHVWKGHGL